MNSTGMKPQITMKTGLKLLFITLLLPQLIIAGGKRGKHKKNKTVYKTYEVGDTGKLNIDNMYGDIHVVSWKNNKVEIRVDVQVDGDNPEAVDDRLDHILIQFSREAENIRAHTEISSPKTSWGVFSWFSSSGSGDTNFRIDYEVKIPEEFDMDISNDYGNIYIDKIKGNLRLNADYGQLDIGELLGDDNIINADYVQHSNIAFIRAGSIHSDYSKLNIDSAYDLRINSDYSTIRIENVRKLNFNGDYGSLHVEKGMDLHVTADGGSHSFGGVHYLKYNGDYGTIKVNDLLPDFDRVIIDGDYSNIRIRNTRQVPYKIDIYQKYGSLKYDDLKIIRDETDISNREIQAYYKEPDSPSYIKINHDYGTLKIYN